MAVARYIFSDLMALALQEADPAQPSWRKALRQGIEDFFTVERTRNTILILIAAVLYYLLAKHAKDKMILTPTRVVVAQELHNVSRSGVTHDDLTKTISNLDSATTDPQEQEKAILAGLALRRDLAAEAARKQLEGLTGPALVSAALQVQDSLAAPVKAYLTKTTLTPEQDLDLRTSVARVSYTRADKTWAETRVAMRRIRKSQSLGVAGLALIVLIVILFGNPAIVAFGVLGAVVSRTIAFFRESTDTDQKYNWVILFLVPIVGGLSAYGGVLLIDAMRTWGLLGDAFTGVNFGGDYATTPTMAAAFLFGFLERLLDNVSSKAADGLGAVLAKENESGAADKPGSSASATATVATNGKPAGGGPGDPDPLPETKAQPPPVGDTAKDEPAQGGDNQTARPGDNETPQAGDAQTAQPVPLVAPDRAVTEVATASVSLGTVIAAVVDDVLATMDALLKRPPHTESRIPDSTEASSATVPGDADHEPRNSATRSAEHRPAEGERDPQSD